MISATLYSNIRKIREWNNLSQQNMADALDISQKHYSRIESGKVDISISMFLRIAQEFNMTPCAIFELEKNAPITGKTTAAHAWPTESLHEMKRLYERLLNEKDRQIERLENLVYAKG